MRQAVVGIAASWRKQMLGEQVVDRLLWIGVGLVVLHDIYFLVLGLSTPLVADHSYRQSQTAITAFWARQDGFRLAYETPVFGFPWAVPLEFPFYQWAIAALNLVGVPIDVGGRLLSFAFLLACIWPIAILRKALAWPQHLLPLVLILFLAAPIHIYWGRAVLIETCALFFALLWLALVVAEVKRPRLSWAMTIAVAAIGAIAMLQKATTFPVYGVIGGCFILARLVKDVRRSDLSSALATLAFGAAACGLPLLVGLAWIKFSDDVKRLNPLADGLTSTAMAAWNYGTWAQRYSVDLLRAIQRTLVDVFGRSAVVAFMIMAAALLFSRRYRTAIAAMLIGFLAFFAIFTNLHIVHNYYQMANAVFLIVAVALALTWIVDNQNIFVALAILAAIVIGQNSFFAERYLWSLKADLTKDDRYQIALRARDIVKPDQALLVLGQDFSSVINYYSERKGIALTTGLGRDRIAQVLQNPDEFLGGMHLAAIAVCWPLEFPYEGNQPLIDAYLAKKQPLATAGRCQLLSTSEELRER